MNLNSKSFRASDCGKLFPKSPLQYFPENNGENTWLMENHFARAATIHFKYILNPPSHTPGIAFHRSPAWWPQKKCRHTTALKFQGQSANQQVLFNQPRQWLIVHLSFKKLDWTLKSLFARQLSIEELTKRFPKFRPILLEENGFYLCVLVEITLTPVFSGSFEEVLSRYLWSGRIRIGRIRMSSFS